MEEPLSYNSISDSDFSSSQSTQYTPLKQDSICSEEK